MAGWQPIFETDTMNLVSIEWLKENMSNQQLVLLDATLPPVGKKWEDFADTGHIPGSLRFDIDELSLHDSGLPHTLLPPDVFQEKMREIGVDNESVIVLYDRIGIYSAPRAWWNFQLMGHDKVYVLNGGLPAWIAAGGTVESQCIQSTRAGNFSVRPVRRFIVDSDEVLAVIDDPQIRIVDVRSPGRFRGEEAEPRPGVKSGHIPSSRNIPFAQLIDGIYLQQPGHLEHIFTSAGCEKNHRLIFSCGSGVTACIGLLAASECGFLDIALYDGSWAEWGSAEDLPIAKG